MPAIGIWLQQFFNVLGKNLCEWNEILFAEFQFSVILAEEYYFR